MFCSQRNRLNDTLCGTWYPRDPPTLDSSVMCVIGLPSSFKVDNKNLLSAAFEGLREDRAVNVISVAHPTREVRNPDEPLPVAKRGGWLVGAIS